MSNGSRHARWEMASGIDSFDPRQLPALTAWISWQGATDTGTLSVPDRMGGSPATQSTGGLKPAVNTNNGIKYGTFTTSALVLPLSAAINGNTKFGVAFSLRLANVTGNKAIVFVGNTAGGASADKTLFFMVGNVLQDRAMTVDRRAQVSPLSTTAVFCYLGIDCTKGTEATQVLMGLDGVNQSVFFSSDTAWPSTLGTPTGNMLIGAQTAAGGTPLAGDLGDLYFFSDQLTAADQVRLKNFNNPF